LPKQASAALAFVAGRSGAGAAGAYLGDFFLRAKPQENR